MKLPTQGLALAIIALLLLPSSGSFAAKPTSHKSPVDVAIETFKKYQSKITSLSIECVSFMEEGPVKGESDMDVDVRENTAESAAATWTPAHRSHIFESNDIRSGSWTRSMASTRS